MATVNEDSLASDEVLASRDETTNEGLSCPLCLNLFRSPRQLPCTHSFCEACLQSHISKTVPERQSCGEFHCPICESKVSIPAEYSVEKWASLFPVSTILLYKLFREKKDGERMCDACYSENIPTQTEGYCVDCNESMCADCLKFHRRQKILKDHNVISINDFITKPESITKFGSDFRCDVHANETLKFICIKHRVPLCSMCVKVNHKKCSSVRGLEEEKAMLMNQIDLNQITKTINKCEDELKKLLAENLTNLNNLKSQTKEIIEQISDLRKKINDVFDDLERKLQQNAETICKEQLIKMEARDRNCQSLKVAMKNTHVLYEAVNKYGTDAQKYILAGKVKHHTSLLQKKIVKTRTQNEALTLHLEINPKLKWMLAIPTRHIVSLKVRRQDGEFIVSEELKPLKGCKTKLVDINLVRDLSVLTSVVYVSQSSIIFTQRNYCCTFDLSSGRITDYCMPKGCDGASSICVIGDNEVAVSVHALRAVYLFSVCDSKLSVKDNFNTRQRCTCIVAISREEIIVSGKCDDGKNFYWSLVTLDGKEKSYYEFDGDGESKTYIALNSRKTLLYMSIHNGDTVHCFGLDGTVYYHITPKGLASVAGVALDRDDNVYIVGNRSGNIFQISPDGEILKVFTESIPSSPFGICFNPTGDKFICFGEGIVDKTSSFLSMYRKWVAAFTTMETNCYLYELI